MRGRLADKPLMLPVGPVTALAGATAAPGPPQTVEGRVLCVFPALYAFAVFGYVTATLATFFIGRDAENDEAELAGATQLAALREAIHRTAAADAVVAKRDSAEERRD